MSGPALGVVIGMFSAKTAIDGLSEGNLAKAVLGGVGAYMGLSSVAATPGATLESKTLEATGTEAGKSAASDIVTSSVDKASSAPSADSVIGAETSGKEMWTLDKASPVQATTEAVGPGPGFVPKGVTTTVSPPPQETGFLDWANKNPVIAYSALQAGGGLLSGYAQGQRQQELLDQMRKDESERRYRMGTQGSVGFLNNYSYSPQKGTWEAKNG